ncbi:MAG: aspartate kinase [Clostridia bacterium]|nr:aspartate kinase [Clostridia bacterium]
MLKTVKFGGSSLANGERFANVKKIIESDPARKAVVVSAPGKRFKKDSKITDLLYLCYAHIKYGVDKEGILNLIKSRYIEIAEELGIDIDLPAIFAEIDENLASGAGEEYLVSRGEYLNARLMASYLGYSFVDSKDCIYINYDDSIDKQRTYAALVNAFAEADKGIVVPGFYGTYPDGNVALMSRGGSDITGAILAAALEADVYENWTDVPGILMADPGIVKDPLPIPHITYAELRELSYMGAKVLHESSVFPVREAGIPVNIRDTANPEHPGTLIAESFDNEGDSPFFITGIAGRKGFSIIDIRLENMARKIGAFREILKIFEKKGIAIEQINSGVDAFSLLISTELLKPYLYQVVSEIQELCDGVRVTESISLLAIVSRRMVFRPGISGLIFGALGREGINIRLIAQGAEELNITIGVADSDFNRTINILYDSFTEKE